MDELSYVLQRLESIAEKMNKEVEDMIEVKMTARSAVKMSKAALILSFIAVALQAVMMFMLLALHPGGGHAGSAGAAASAAQNQQALVINGAK